MMEKKEGAQEVNAQKGFAESGYLYNTTTSQPSQELSNPSAAYLQKLETKKKKKDEWIDDPEKDTEPTEEELALMTNYLPGLSVNADIVAICIRGNYFRWINEYKKWYYFFPGSEENELGAGLWKPDVSGKALELARFAIKKIYRIAQSKKSESERKMWIAWGVRSDSSGPIKAALEFAALKDGINASAAWFDADPDFIKVENGAIHLWDKPEFVNYDPEYGEDFNIDKIRDAFFTKSLAVRYEPDDDCPRWRKFISEIWPEAIGKYMQKVIGLCLTDNMREQKIWCLYGVGANGKSVLCYILKRILGTYALTIDADVLMENRNKSASGPSPELVQLVGKKLVLAPEGRPGQQLNQALVQKLTSGIDEISARELYSDPFTFLPVCKIFMITNHKPKIVQGPHSIWRRLRLIPFKRVFAEHEQDKQLEEKLMRELPGILNWVLEGLMAYKAEGLEDIPEIMNATDDYRAGQDVIGLFLDDVIDDDPAVRLSGKVQAGNTYQRYKAWAEENGEFVMSQKTFREAMSERGWIYGRNKIERFYEKKVTG